MNVATTFSLIFPTLITGETIKPVNQSHFVPRTYQTYLTSQVTRCGTLAVAVHFHVVIHQVVDAGANAQDHADNAQDTQPLADDDGRVRAGSNHAASQSPREPSRQTGVPSVLVNEQCRQKQQSQRHDHAVQCVKYCLG